MPPRRHPRSWLAGRLRSAAGAVQRLAGRVEPAVPLPASPPSAPPTAAPRRFGEPPQHWLDLVSAHAPGLLHDLDLDMSPVGSDDATARDDRPGDTGSVGRLGGGVAGPATGGAVDGSTSVSGAVAAGRRGGVSGLAGPDGSRSPGGTGRSGRTPAPGDGPAGEAGSPGRGGASASGPDTPAGPSARPGAGGDPAPVRGSGLPRAGETAQPVRPLVRPAISGPPATPGNDRQHRTNGPETTRPTPRPPATTGDLLADRLSVGHDGFRGDRDQSGDDQTRSREAQPRFTSGQPGFADDHPRFAGGRGDPGATRPSGPDSGATRRAPAGPDLDAVDRGAPWTGSAGATGAADAEGTTVDRRRDLGHAASDWPWLALPDEPARPRQQPRRPVGLRVDEAETVGGGAWAGGWGHVPTGGRSTSTGTPSSTVEARVTDPWPALPDDATLWAVPGDALNDAQLSRLDREQAGG
ncbi:hypothetical protein [Micromonospora parathelypteridis]|uniref:Uncharacterized protein n=1 Tax=Micromonospora parathelypteridis TaxID=1839617 RepID=A0A840VWU1_9ACTN|nr:hypothetical protein [Micromonospora parathelypteridis]MBB5475531.1 hypothetical protein [Micromonospora parathelypteridis]GGO27851.1 hypothetical protein GCM10011576_52870 [Micromonospora parathelypteridis]